MSGSSPFLLLLVVQDGIDAIGDCLASIEAQEIDGLELLVADDASHDGTRLVLERWLERTRVAVGHRLLVQGQRTGLTACAIDLLAQAGSRAGVACVFDARDRLEGPHALRRMALEIERGADAALSALVRNAPPTRPTFCLPDAVAAAGIDAPESCLLCVRSELLAKGAAASHDLSGQVSLRPFRRALLRAANDLRVVPEFLVQTTRPEPLADGGSRRLQARQQLASGAPTRTIAARQPSGAFNIFDLGLPEPDLERMPQPEPSEAGQPAESTAASVPAEAVPASPAAAEAKPQSPETNSPAPETKPPKPEPPAAAAKPATITPAETEKVAATPPVEIDLDEPPRRPLPKLRPPPERLREAAQDPLAYAFENMARLRGGLSPLTAPSAATDDDREADDTDDVEIGTRGRGRDDDLDVEIVAPRRGRDEGDAADDGDGDDDGDILSFDLGSDSGDEPGARMHFTGMLDLEEDDPDLQMPDFFGFVDPEKDATEPEAEAETEPQDHGSDEVEEGRTDPASRARAIAEQIAECLAELQEDDGGFLEAEFSGKEFAAALWFHIDRERYQPNIERAIEGSRRRMAKGATKPQQGSQWEFLLYAWTSMGVFSDPGVRVDNRRLLAWQLLLATVDVRFGLVLPEAVIRRVAANMRTDGAIPTYDQAEVKDPTVSDQDHAFATLLLGELHQRHPRHRRVAQLAESSYIYLTQSTRLLAESGSPDDRTSFAHAAAYRCFARAGDENLMSVTLDQLEASRWDAGLYPIRNEPQELDESSQEIWNPASRYFDSLPFLGLHLAVDPAQEAIQ